uniref:ubiquitinyl hydrolase 1 n=1 Tax=Gadus morhua TaxID=8049 RepID=A0A8C4ZGS2_GADMO
MPGASGGNVEGSCQALCQTLISQNGLQRETADISQSVLYTSLMGLLLVTDNECFLNAVVQCLSHTPGLRDYCLLKTFRQEKSSKEEAKLMEGTLSTHQAILTTMLLFEVNPRQFYSIFKETVPYFSGYSQQDAQEFLRFLLDRLHTEVNRRVCVRRTGKEPVQKYAAAMWKKHLERDDSKIVDLFSGQLRSSLHCSVCSHHSNTFDVFCDLSLPMPKRGSTGGVTLRECLDLFSQEEKLDKENAPMCERCTRRTQSTKRLSIQRFPQVIVIQNLCPLAGAVLYDLYAVCNHSGTVNMGHYTACCREDNGWCFYNDSSVTPVSENQLQTNQAYVLFYQRTNSNSTLRK